jgi:diguanylate cyclase (GGDEF)-like protein
MHNELDKSEAIDSSNFMEQSFEGSNENYEVRLMRATLRIFSFFGTFSHILFIFLFMALGSIELSMLNIICALIWVLTLYTGAKNKFALTINIMVLEMIFHASIVTYLLGPELGFHFYLWPAMGLILASPMSKSSLSMIYFSIIVSLFVVLSLELSLGNMLEPLRQAQNIENTDIIDFIFAANVIASAFPFILTIRFFQKNREEGEKQLFQLANKDELTGLFNRRFIFALMNPKNDLERRNKDYKEYAVILVDIDDLKKINDKFGTDVGDMLLTNVADILKSTLRTTDVVARWGAGEFLIIMNKIDIQEAKSIMDKLHSGLVRKTIMTETNMIEISYSLGGAIAQNNESFEKIVQRADLKLYEAKNHNQESAFI